MLTLAEIRDWVKKISKTDKGYIGHLDGSVDNCIGIYNLKTITGYNNGKHRPLGSVKAYDIKGISILVHGSKSKSQTEALAQRVYDALDGIHKTVIGKTNIIDVQLLQDAPVDVDFDANGIYEYVIELVLIMEV